MAKTLVEVRNPNDPGHIGDHELSARLLNELYGVAAYAPAAGGTVNPDIALGGVHEIALPAGAITVGPIVSSDSAAIQRYNPGQRLVLVLTQPAAGGATVTWDASWRRATSGIDPRPNAVTTIEFVNDAAAGAAPQWRPSAIAPTALESVRVWHTDTANPAVVVRGAAAQAANLTEWQSSAGTVVAKVDQVGSLQARLGTFAAGAATEVPLTAQGAASQTADLQRWLSSAAAVLAKVDAAGILTAAGLITAGVLTVSGGGAHSIVGSLTETGQTLSKPSVATQVPQVMQGFASQTADLTQWQDSTGSTMAKVGSGGAIQVDASRAALAVTPAMATYGSAAFHVGTPAANYVGEVIRGFVSQTADLQQWQSSAGTTLSRVGSDGGLHVLYAQNDASGSYLLAAGGTTPNNSMVAAAAGHVPLAVKAFASQTADLQQWQNSAAANLVRVTSVGNIYSRANAAQGIDVNADVHLNAGGASDKPLVVRAFAGQAANLTEWQKSDGTVQAFFDPAGDLRVGVAAAGWDGSSWLQVNPTGAAKGIVIRAGAAQSSNLQQWQNSTGGVLAYADNVGTFGAQGAYGANVAAYSADLRNSTSTASIGLYITMQSGQIGDAIDIGTSTGGQVAKITASGNVQGTGAYTTLSDASAKTNVRALVHDPLDVIRRLRPRHYDYRDGGPFGGERDQVGFVAQELQAVLPQAVVAFDADRLGTRSEAIVAYLVAAVQELDRRTAAAA